MSNSPRDAFEVVALELMNFVTSKTFTKLCILIRPVTAIVPTITQIIVFNAQMIFALKLVLPTVPTIRIPRTTSQFIAQIKTVSFTIAFKIFLDTVPRLALEFSGGTGVVGALGLVRPVAAVVVVVALPPAGDTLVVGAPELGLGTLAVPT